MVNLTGLYHNYFVLVSALTEDEQALLADIRKRKQQILDEIQVSDMSFTCVFYLSLSMISV